MPKPVPRPPLVLKKRSDVEPEEPKKLGRKKHVPIPDLEKTILQEKGGVLEVLEVPEKPAPGQDSFAFQTQQMTAVEHIMFQGIRTPHLIAQALGINERLAERYVSAVLDRWATVGSDVDIKRQRGEALNYMDFLQNQLWTQYNRAKNIVDGESKKPANEQNVARITRNQTLMLQLNAQITQLNGQKNELNGLTPQAIANISIIGGTDDVEVLQRLRKQEVLKEAMLRFGKFIMQKQEEKAANSTVEV